VTDVTWPLAVLSLVATELIGRKLRVGWHIGAMAGLAWAVYAVITHQFGMAAINTIYAGQAVRNAVKWRREEITEEVVDG